MDLRAQGCQASVSVSVRKDWEVLNSLLLIDCQAGQHEGLQSLVWSRQPGEPI